MSNEHDTSRILAALEKGDRSALESLARLEGPRLKAIAYQVTRDLALAEDVVQETLLRILLGRAPFRQEGSAAAWLGRMAARLALNAVRERKRRQRREEVHTMARDPSAEPPGASIFREEEAEVLSQGLQLMSAADRAALWLHVVEGVGIREVAATLGSTRSTMSRRIRTSLKELRKFLEGRGLALEILPLAKLLKEIPAPHLSPAFLPELLESARQFYSRPETIGQELPLELPVEDEDEDEDEDLDASRRLPRFPAPLKDLRVVLPLGLAVLISLSPLLRFTGLFGWREEPVRTVRSDPAPAPPASRIEAGTTPGPDGTAAEVRKPVLLAGIVLNSQGLPEPGALVTAYQDLGRLDPREILKDWSFVDLGERFLAGVPPLGTATADAQGRFELAVEDRPHLILHALSAGPRPMESGTKRISPGPTPEKLQLLLEIGSLVRGRVLDRRRRPLSGARIFFLPNPKVPEDRDFTSNDLGIFLEHMVPLVQVSGPDGRFEFPALSFREVSAYQIVVCLDGYARLRVDLGYAPPGIETDVEVALDAGAEIPGLAVTADGKAAAGARIIALGPIQDEYRWFDTAITDGRGSFVIHAPLGEPVKFVAKLPGFSRAEIVEWRPEPGEVPLIEFRGQGILRGRLLDRPTGKPATGVRIVCRDPWGALGTSEALTDGQGAFGLSGLSLDSCSALLVLAPGRYHRYTLGILPKSGAPEIHQDFDLLPTADVEGRVLGPDREPVPGARVELINLVESEVQAKSLRWRAEMLGRKDVFSDEKGKFLCEDVVPVGKLFIWAYHDELGEGFTGMHGLLLNETRREGVEVQLDHAGLEVLVVDPRGQLIQGLRTNLLNMWIVSLGPKGMGYVEWLNNRTSVDLSGILRRFCSLPPASRQEAGSLSPGSRMLGQEALPCRWTDLIAAPYFVSFFKQLGCSDGDIRGWDKDGWSYNGLFVGLKPKEFHTLRIVVDPDRALRGRVVDPEGNGVWNLRVNVHFDATIPGLKNGEGSSVSHTDERGFFRCVGIGPGPYRLSIRDQDQHQIEVKDIPGDQGDLKVLWAPGAGEQR